MKLICLLSISILLFLASGYRDRLLISATIENIVSEYRKAVRSISTMCYTGAISIKNFLVFFISGKPVVNVGNKMSGHQLIINPVEVMTVNIKVFNKYDII